MLKIADIATKIIFQMDWPRFFKALKIHPATRASARFEKKQMKIETMFPLKWYPCASKPAKGELRTSVYELERLENATSMADSKTAKITPIKGPPAHAPIIIGIWSKEYVSLCLFIYTLWRPER